MWFCLLCCTRWCQPLSLCIKLQCVTIQVKAILQYFSVVLFIMLYMVVPTFKSVSESLVCDHSNESYRVEVLSGTSTSTSQSDQSNETFIRFMRHCLKELRAVLLCSYVYRTFKFRDCPRDCLENRVLCVIFP